MREEQNKSSLEREGGRRTSISSSVVVTTASECSCRGEGAVATGIVTPSASKTQTEGTVIDDGVLGEEPMSKAAGGTMRTG